MDKDALAAAAVAAMWEKDRASRDLGMKIERVGYQYADVSMRVRDDMVNGYDSCHGGFIFTLADSAFAFACNSENESAVAASAAIDFIRPAQKGDLLTACARAIHQGGRSGIYDITVTNQHDKIIAQFRGRSARVGGNLIASRDCP